MTRYITLVFFGCWFLITATSLHAAADLPVLRTGFVHFPPFKYADENGNASGPWVDMTEIVAAEAGFRIEWINLPIARVYLYLKRGQIDLWPGVAGIPELQGRVRESVVTPMQLRLFAFHRRNTKPPKQLTDLKGEPVILISGFSYMGALDAVDLSDDDLSYAPDHHSALRMLELQRGRYVLDYDAPISALRDQFPGLDLTGSAIYEARGAFLVSDTRPDAEQIVRKLDRAYNRLIEQGKLETLQQP